VNIYIFDLEVYKYDWTFVAKRFRKDEKIYIHNDAAKLKEFLAQDPVLAGFNSKWYDGYIIKLINAGYDNPTIKSVSDWIIENSRKKNAPPIWDHPLIKRAPYLNFKTFDIKDDMQIGMSLKSVAAHLGLSIVESDIPFDINRPLTEAELNSNYKYSLNDVLVTEKIIELRANYLNTKMELGRRIGLEDDKALRHTNARMVAAFLGAKKQYYTDDRDLYIPDTIDWNYIPQEVELFFRKTKDKSITDKELWKTSYTHTIRGMKTKYAWGGVHGALKNYFAKSDGEYIILIFDVASLYPSLMIEYDLLSRSVQDKQAFKKIKDERIEFKRLGLKKKDLGNKLVLNITFGASGLESNPLYDLRSNRSVCVSGQLLMTDLIYHYDRELTTVEFINFNTDGIMLKVHKSEVNKVYKINEEWQKRTRLVLEETKIKTIAQKDVNNYVMIEENGKIKEVGSYFKAGENLKGSWSINNTFNIVKKGLTEYLLNGIDPSVTVNASNNVFDFQIIAKAGQNYREVKHIVGDKAIDVQKVNRVYASKDKTLGTLKKLHIDKDNDGDKIASLPDHCIIDNENTITIDKIDKEWYIDLVRKRIEQFYGKKRGRK
jgi:hypothetical protein